MTLLARYLPPLAADFIGLALASALLPRLGSRFQEFGFGNTVVIGFVFVLFCLGVYGIKKLQRDKPTDLTALLPALFAKRTLAAFGVFFALALTLATAYIAGFLDSVIFINRELLDETAVTLYLLLTPASWFGLALIYMLLLSNETEATVTPGTMRYAVLATVALSGVNLMAITTTAVWQAVWSRFSPPENFVPFMVINFVLYLLLYGPPRLLYLAKNPNLIAVVSFMPLLLHLATISIF